MQDGVRGPQTRGLKTLLFNAKQRFVLQTALSVSCALWAVHHRPLPRRAVTTVRHLNRLQPTNRPRRDGYEDCVNIGARWRPRFAIKSGNLPHALWITDKTNMALLLRAKPNITTPSRISLVAYRSAPGEICWLRQYLSLDYIWLSFVQ